MTAKDYLNQAYRANRKIQLDVEKVAAMRSALYGKGTSCDGEVSRSLNGNGIERAIQRVIDYEQRIDEEIGRLIDLRLKIMDMIESVPDDTLREVLERRYLLYQKWEVIAEKMGFSERQIFRLHGKALKKMSLNVTIEL